MQKVQKNSKLANLIAASRRCKSAGETSVKCSQNRQIDTRRTLLILLATWLLVMSPFLIAVAEKTPPNSADQNADHSAGQNVDHSADQNVTQNTAEQRLWAMLDPKEHPGDLKKQPFADLPPYSIIEAMKLGESALQKEEDSWTVAVFNPTGRDRAALVHTFVPKQQRQIKECEYIVRSLSKDSSYVAPCYSECGGFFYFRTDYIPQLGSMRFRITPRKPGDPEFPASDISVDEKQGIIENSKLRVQFDMNTGSIISLKRKGNDHEFVSQTDQSKDDSDAICIVGQIHENGIKKSKANVFIIANPAFASVKIVYDQESRQSKGIDMLFFQLETNSDRLLLMPFPLFINGYDPSSAKSASLSFSFSIPDGKGDSFYGYSVLANDQLGVDLFMPEATQEDFVIESGRILVTNVVGGNFRGAICPFAAFPDDAIAKHISEEITYPLFATMISPETTFPTDDIAGIEINERNIVMTACCPANDKSGDILVQFFNPTSETQTFEFKMPGRTQKFYTDESEKRGDPATGKLKLPSHESIWIRVAE
ncbi:MAG: hypothetical protein ACRCUY_04595 [Thermoguttaceae bacterium]